MYFFRSTVHFRLLNRNKMPKRKRKEKIPTGVLIPQTKIASKMLCRFGHLFNTKVSLYEMHVRFINFDGFKIKNIFIFCAFKTGQFQLIDLIKVT